MRHRRPSIRHICAAALVALALPACGSDGGGRSVTIYSGRTENLIGPLLEDFSERTGIGVKVRYGDSPDLALLIDEEGDATPADVFLSQNPGAVGFLQGGDRLAELPAEILDLVPSGVEDPGGHWVGFSGRQRVLVYNTDELAEDELPDSVFDVVTPAWEGRLGVAPSNGSFQDFVTAMRAAEGDDVAQAFLEDLAATDPEIYPNNNSVVQAVSRGEVDAGLVNHYYNVRFLEEEPDSPTENHYFSPDDPGSLVIVTAATMLDGTEHREEAVELIRFLLEEDAQRYFAGETFEYPLAAGVEPAQDLPPVDFEEIEVVDFSTLEGGIERTREMIADAGLES